MTVASTPVRRETVAKLKVAINGFGRIGRNFLWCWHGRKDSPLDVVVVNDSGGVKNASHLLKCDSMLGTFKAEVKIVDDTTISFDGKPVKVVSNRDPLKLPWADLGIDIVTEGTRVFVDGPGPGKHIQAGAKKVIITALAKGAPFLLCDICYNAKGTSFSKVVAAQLTPKTVASTPVRRETVAKLKVAINGFGCIGRNFLRCWYGRKDSPLDVVVVNDSGGVKNASHLLKYDSMLGTFKAEVKIVDDTTISVDRKPIKVVSNRDPLKLPWANHGIDIVIEGTGVFVDGPRAGKHIQAGAKKVIITAPPKGADVPTYVVGVNEGDYSHEVSNIISNASCTTNCSASFVKVMDEELGLKLMCKNCHGTMTTTHSYTGDQRLLDPSYRDLRRSRAAALNIVPTSTGAVKAISLVLPQLKGKLNRIALRVPTPNVSVIDLVVNVEKKGITAEDVNVAFRKATEGPLKGILAVCDVPLVSVDVRCSDVSSTIDSSLTMVMGDDMVKVVAWYDNEWGYSQRVVDLAHLVASKWPGMPTTGSGDPLEDFYETNPADEECKVYEA
ncbi:hypothetical protein SLEP1_g51605 [Rubroshorea leprosula]|uniref:glyceraldehyde-3-phosphate dehydrogenase (NADP(+)) (phosphorylating) n=1 Tax=Rubroshorea leprosula TaxID=152421 RepID=A0AAV5M3Q1_9ROSI|nr:hypothetical protein SLEP1_g51605 [Rubroshorea leprosula]